MTYQIANCPHCGGEGTIKIIQMPFSHGWVGCQKCKYHYKAFSAQGCKEFDEMRAKKDREAKKKERSANKD